MKKALIFITSIFIISFLTSCIDSQSYNVYSESWFDTTGYVVKNENGSFKEFVEGTNGKPENQATAIRWEHRYIRSPVCELTPQKWDSENIEYVDMDRDYNFEITSTPRTINGIIFYRDSENVYIINNKYDQYKDKDFRDKDEFRFKIKINGIREIEFKMVKRNGNENW